MRIILAISLLGAIGGLSGCVFPGSSSAPAPAVDNCKSHADQAACAADKVCKWKAEAQGKPAHCKSND